MYMRNRYMVDNSAFCVCYLNRQKGGTMYTALYAMQEGASAAEFGDCQRLRAPDSGNKGMKKAGECLFPLLFITVLMSLPFFRLPPSL